MTDVRNRINLLLLCLVTALGITIVLLPAPEADRPPPAVAYDPGAVKQIALDRLDEAEPLRLERREDGWFMTHPDKAPADGRRIAQALGALRQHTRSCYPAADHEPVEFGLAPPQAELELDSMRIAFGYRTSDGRRYIRAMGRLCLVADVTLPVLASLIAQPAKE